MKTKLICFLLCLSLFPGCVVLHDVEARCRVADTVAYDVASEVLLVHPEYRSRFITAHGQLVALEQQPVIDVLAVIEILKRLPPEALQSRRARIGYDAATLIITLAGDPALKPKAAEELKATVHCLGTGWNRALVEAPLR